MYLRWLQLRNLKLLRSVDITFTRNREMRPWTVFVGENGLCKTALLQAIAMAASGPSLANELADVTSLPDRRARGAHTSIFASFGFGPGAHSRRDYPGLRSRPAHIPELLSHLVTESGWREFVGTSSYTEKENAVRLGTRSNPLLEARRAQFPRWFVAGYGTLRSLPRPRSSREEDLADPIKHRLDNLFDRGDLIATGFADLFKPELARAYSRILKKVLVNSGILPRVTQLDLSGAQAGITSAQELKEAHLFQFNVGKSSVSIPATWLSRGYQGTIAWIADLVGQLLLDAGEPIEPEEMEGLVLVDELDLHLHPKWQAALIPALKKTFPRLQFVGTTHSAMLLPGLAQDEILLLKQDEKGSVSIEPAPASPALMTGSELFDAFFGIQGLYPTELAALRKTLRADPGAGFELPDSYSVVKRQLWRAHHYKCCYCEHLEQGIHNDVEHYRPKSRADRKPGSAQTHGYWWLAWTWTNLLFACAPCNRSHKQVRFPLEPGSKALRAGQQPPGREKPLLLDPAAEDPLPHLHFVPFTLHGKQHWLPSARNGSARGQTTIEVLGLARPDLLDLYRAHVDQWVRPQVKSLHEVMRTRHRKQVRETWSALTRELLDARRPFTALSHDALAHLVPEAERQKWGLLLPSP